MKKPFLVSVLLLVVALAGAGSYAWHENQQASHWKIEANTSRIRVRQLAASLASTRTELQATEADAQSFQNSLNGCLADFKVALGEMAAAGPYPSFYTLATIEGEIGTISRDCPSVNGQFQQMTQDLNNALSSTG